MTEAVTPTPGTAPRATVLASVGALITDPDDRVLLVKPTYRDHWQFVGGAVDEGELPHAALHREIAEETGLPLDVGPLLVFDWGPPPRADLTLPLIHLLFDCGTLDAATAIRLPADELAAYRFADVDTALDLLSAHDEPRLRAGLRTRSRHRTVYLPTEP